MKGLALFVFSCGLAAAKVAATPPAGLPGGRELIAGQEQFLSELFKNVKDGAGQGKKLEELQVKTEDLELDLYLDSDRLMRIVAPAANAEILRD